MNSEAFLYGIIGWGILLAVALVNGYIRNATYEKALGNRSAHYISVAVLIACSCGIAYWIMQWFSVPPASSVSVAIGFLWVGLSLLFEFGLGHYVAGMSWKKLLEDYNLSRGRVLILVLLTQLFAPLGAWYVLYQ